MATTARSPFILKPEELAAIASDRILRRAVEYARSGRVTDLRDDGRTLEARVAGSRREPYVVRIEHDGEELIPSCSCPFDWEPFCKHSAAALAARSGIDQKPGTPADEVRELELHARRKRGETGGFRIRPLSGDRALGAFAVRSASGETYEVWIRSHHERLNRCTCADHASSMLGTCKHIEAVLHFAERRAKARVAALRSGRGLPPMVVVSREDADYVSSGGLPVGWQSFTIMDNSR
ncbi:MAG: hypothetical protein QME96_10020, partial [Myxococcota bacterium]|nr:hypothetical protein [Myxococcota bacterium]